ncbi:THUMP domain-containing class I SAM-dependent RNA methyltransferase [Spirochaeta africana]|uniref:Putative N6-adenine-specific DNA methylase n=1 Tax=Spirochaeta africana (strain ATCC 700263 / DSM 8902 / Z-7692) TaxID=889378 RepID=H9UM73_SPIAZ|nr:N-6 DNA methylase [Spirochaeta africana]AFG38616.1 putative N6-adenine-specific DNA methylase [Spirochaeta africana DSM 8902]
MINSTGNFFAVAVPGTEGAVAAELRELGVEFPAAEHGGVSWQGRPVDAERIAGLALTPSRLLMRIAEFPVTRFPELVRKTANLPWDQLLSRPDFSVRASCHRSKLYHSAAVEQRIRLGIEQRIAGSPLLHAAPVPDHPSTLIVVRIQHNQCQISITLGNPDLHRRGYRHAGAKAPLRENLAAVLLQLSGWDGNSALYDPFCGSGTIPIEAALLARRRGYSPNIYGSDRDAGACSISATNAAQAGCSAAVTIRQHSISDLHQSAPHSHVHVVTNPPYGKRINSTRDMRNLYARFGKVLQTEFPGSSLTVLCTAGTEGDILLGQLGFPVQTVTSFSNGGLPTAVRTGTIPV